MANTTIPRLSICTYGCRMSAVTLRISFSSRSGVIASQARRTNEWRRLSSSSGTLRDAADITLDYHICEFTISCDLIWIAEGQTHYNRLITSILLIGCRHAHIAGYAADSTANNVPRSGFPGHPLSPGRASRTGWPTTARSQLHSRKPGAAPWSDGGRGLVCCRVLSRGAGCCTAASPARARFSRGAGFRPKFLAPPEASFGWH